MGGTGVSVGIGNTAPNNKLEITTGVANTSGLRFTNLTSASSATDLSDRNNLKVLTVDASGNVILRRIDPALLVISILGGSGRIGASDSWTLNGRTGTIQTLNDSPVSIGNGIKRLPEGYKLYVSEGILTEKVKVALKDSDEWADYVFADNYKLRTLNDVERYVKQNKHLPGVPSAEQVAKEGIDVGKMDAKLLEKIEELTLYLIEQRKELDSIREENKQMKAKMLLLESKNSH
ncbi:hypothetical protein [Spirosoma telluris]|uniref:hypothetical protein n=1 Tax=Spirosoma telluris TaxID=2183553 RepID=UPI002FC3D81C